jgi:CheY-like chemotaxis protein
MNMAPATFSFSKPEAEAPRKKRILLVVSSRAKRDMRAQAMRKLGIDVDCAVNIDEARYWWRADLYHLVLLDVANELGIRDQFCRDIRGAKPPQQFAFMVGAPSYLSNSPEMELGMPAGVNSENGLRPPSVSLPLGPKSQRWGILEASRQISAVRSMWAARTQARSNRPEPPRDSEIRGARQAELSDAQLSAEVRTAMEISNELQREGSPPVA